MSTFVNIDQTRAQAALNANSVKKQGDEGQGDEGDSLSGYPSLIINNGLIACIAFSVNKEKQHRRIADAIAKHLNAQAIITSTDARSLRDALCQCDSFTLRRATDEALAFLSYLKRFHRS